MEQKSTTIFNEIFSQDLIKKIKMTSEIEDGNDTYKLSLNLDSSELENFIVKLQSILEENSIMPSGVLGATTENQSPFTSMDMSFWIDKKAYYTRKITIGAKYSTPQSLYTKATTGNIAIVIKQSKLGEKFDITAPDNATPLEQLIKDFMGGYSSLYGTGTGVPPIPGPAPYSPFGNL